MEKFTITPQGINHNESPAFVAVWFSGDEALENQNQDGYYFDGDGQATEILITRIEWQDEKPDAEEYNHLMDRAITAIDNWIIDRM